MSLWVPRKRPRTPAQRPYSSSLAAGRPTDVGSDEDLQLHETTSTSSNRPFFRIYFNDVYEVHLPPKHRFPMKKYEQVRKKLQQWIDDLPTEEKEAVNCGTWI